MSRIGNKLIKIPEGLNVTLNGDVVDIKGKVGEDKVKFDKNLMLKLMMESSKLLVKMKKNTPNKCMVQLVLYYITQ